MTFDEWAMPKLYSKPSSLPNNISGDSDISMLSPLLSWYASQSDLVIEIGLRDGYSTAALFSGRPKKIISIDKAECKKTRSEIESINNLPSQWEFIQGDSAEINLLIPSWDTLFIDGEHTSRQVAKELARFSSKTNKWIIFHDTAVSFREDPETSFEGMGRAINEFLDKGGWKTVFKTDMSNGLLVLERIQQEIRPMILRNKEDYDRMKLLWGDSVKKDEWLVADSYPYFVFAKTGTAYFVPLNFLSDLRPEDLIALNKEIVKFVVDKHVDKLSQVDWVGRIWFACKLIFGFVKKMKGL